MSNATIETPKDEIKVVIRVDDFDKEVGRPMTHERWVNWIVNRLCAAGIPMTKTGPVTGSIMRVDDPTDFASTIWYWKP